MRDFTRLVFCVIGCELVGILGAFFTIEAIPSWYRSLNKPFFSPPNWIFGPVWTILYLLMGISFYLILNKGWNKKQVKSAGMYFLTQLALNFIWTPIFFGLRTPLFGLIVILTLWALIIFTMKKFYILSRAAFYLLIPYFLWVSFATILNAAILLLNY